MKQREADLSRYNNELQKKETYLQQLDLEQTKRINIEAEASMKALKVTMTNELATASTLSQTSTDLLIHQMHAESEAAILSLQAQLQEEVAEAKHSSESSAQEYVNR